MSDLPQPVDGSAQPDPAPLGFVAREDGVRLAHRWLPGRLPALVFLPGFRSDMGGGKATALAIACVREGRALLRLDYSGHGSSGGTFEAGTIGRWRDDALLLLDRLVPGPSVLVGSSMGGWIALLLALARPERVRAVLGIAAAPDFTERLIWDALAPPERERLLRDGVLFMPGDGSSTLPVTRALVEEGRCHLLLDAPISLRCPVRLLHGQADASVPWELSLRLAARLEAADVRVTLVKDGDHRLSRPSDLRLVTREALVLAQDAQTAPLPGPA